MIAAPRSGSGKTTVTAAILRALSRRGIKVRPYKVGPDYLDPTYHVAACGETSYNLDTWMMDPGFLTDHFIETSSGYRLSLVEGVMGLFDGKGAGHAGSSAEIARVLGIPVILVADCSGMSGSIAPLAAGFTNFDPGVRIAGIILNNVAGESHLSYLRGALEDASAQSTDANISDVKIVGHVFRDSSLELPGRHLGLVTAPWGVNQEQLDQLSERVTQHIDLDLLLEMGDSHAPLRLRTGRSRTQAGPNMEECSTRTGPAGPDNPDYGHGPSFRCTIAVAWDEAFHFYYQANLDLLRAAGARVRFFSPLDDRHIPGDADGLYLGGGYPELHAARLSDNREMRTQIARFAAQGRPVYAECGGLIYLGNGIHAQYSGQDDRFFPLCGVLDLEFRMLARRKRLGYAEVSFNRDTFLGTRGQTARGHEFHYSELVEPADTAGLRFAYSVITDGGRQEGFSTENVLASYIHLHFGSYPGMARRFVNRCSNTGAGCAGRASRVDKAHRAHRAPGSAGTQLHTGGTRGKPGGNPI
jgi:cobyrinic acid a,c-diamide synthase